jgi:hypothetical protein
MSGTSASCPQVAGVAALMLSVNPCLTPVQVEDMLKKSCTQVGGYTYTNNRCDEMGYGLIDAAAAVNRANAFSILQHKTETTKILHALVGKIRAGYQVDPNQTLGNYEIVSPASVEIKSGHAITFEPGFIAQRGGVMLAHIEHFVNDCRNWPVVISNKKSQTNQGGLAERTLVSTPVNIYPNPFSDNINMDMDIVQASSNASIIVTDITGRLVYEHKGSYSQGKASLKIPIVGSASLYIVKVCIDNDCTIQKLVKYDAY